MGLRLAQEFEAVRREIDHEDAPARRHEARRLADRAGRIVEVVQHLVDDDEVEGVARERRRIDVALAQLDAASGRPSRDWRGPPTAWRGWHRARRSRLARGASSCSMRPVPVPRSSEIADRRRSRGRRAPQPRPPPRAHAGSGCGPIRAQGARRRPARPASAGRARLRAGSGRPAAADRTRSRLSRIGRRMRAADAPVGRAGRRPRPLPGGARRGRPRPEASDGGRCAAGTGPGCR